MKRVILCSLFLLMAPVALQAKVPWGVLEQVDPTATHTAVDDPLTILKKLTSGMPVKVHFTIQDLSTDLGRDNELDSLQLNRRPNRHSTIASQISQAASDNMAHRNEINAFYLRALQKGIDYWFEAATAMINQQGEPEQFPEVLKRLSHQANFQVVAQEDQADLRVLVTKPETIQQRCRRADALACVFPAAHDGESPLLIMPAFHIKTAEADSYTGILVHELGHVLGLDDQYIGGSSPSFKYRSTFRDRDGLMTSHNTETLDCDAVDGLVNLIDIIYGTESARQDGWPSLCEGSKDVYANGTVLGSRNYLFEFFKGEPTAQLFTWQQDLQAAKPEKVLPFVETDPLAVIPDQQVLQKDHLDRPLRAKGPAGEDIYYMYLYEDTWRLITKKGKALRVEFFADFGESMVMQHRFWIPKNQRIGVLQMYYVSEVEKGEGPYFQVSYTEKKLEDADLENYVFLVGYEMNKNGQFESIGEGDLPPAPQLEKLLSLTADWWNKQNGEYDAPSAQQSSKPSSAKRKTAKRPATKASSHAAQQSSKPSSAKRKTAKSPATKASSHARQADQAKQAIKRSLRRSK